MAPTTDNSSVDSKAAVAKKARNNVKKPRDMPTRPLSAYNFFFREQRAKILEEREEEARATGRVPDKSDLFAILGKTIAARWKSQTDEQRAKYKALAADDMKRYRADMDSYHETIAKSIHKDNKSSKGKSGKKAKSKPAQDHESTDGSEVAAKKSPSSKASAAPKVSSVPTNKSPRSTGSNRPPLPTPPQGAPATGFRPESSAFAGPGLGGAGLGMSGLSAGMGGPGFGGGLGPGGVGLGGPGLGPGLGPNAASLDMMTYQNILRQRELAALRERQAAMGMHPPGFAPGPAGMDSLLLRGGAGAGMGGLGLMDRHAMAPGASPPMGAHSAGITGLGLSGSGYGAGLDFPLSENARAGLTPEEQLYLLRRGQDDANLSIRLRLELMQQQQEARQMQHLMELQQQQGPSSMALMQERQRLMERQRLEQLLASQSLAGMGGAPGY